MSIAYRDVTAVAPAVTHFPEWVVALENLGFVRLGRVQGDVVPGGVEALMADYEPAARDQALAAYQVPTVVLVAPDGSAFADVDWFWGSPSVRIRTLTTDGRLVSTHRAWEHMPPWPIPMRSAARFRTLAQEQRLSVARGRSLEVVADAGADELWQRHGAQLAERVATPEPHDTLADYIRMAERALEHEQRCADRARLATLTALAVLVVLAITIVPLLVPAARSTWGLVVVFAGAAALAWLAGRPLAARVRYVRWIRPRFR